MGNLKGSQLVSLLGLAFSAVGTIAMGVATIMRNQEANEKLINQTQETLMKIFESAGEDVEIQEI